VAIARGPLGDAQDGPVDNSVLRSGTVAAATGDEAEQLSGQKPADGTAARLAATQLPRDKRKAARKSPRRQRRVGACVVCMDLEANHVLNPCGHLSLCGPCATTLLDKEQVLCPVCKELCVSALRVFEVAIPRSSSDEEEHDDG
jgi:hypothetical protein